MKILKLQERNPNERYIAMAADALRNGDIIIYPTDTLYAVGCDALNNSAILKVCKRKNINPEKTHLSIVCDSISMASEYARFNDQQFKMLRRNLPGPFTFVFPSSLSLPKVFKGRKTVGIRIPDNQIAISLVSELGRPILSTTIEYADEDYAVNPDLIAETYAETAIYLLDGGEGGIVPSTVVDCTDDIPKILREGKGELQY